MKLEGNNKYVQNELILLFCIVDLYNKTCHL